MATTMEDYAKQPREQRLQRLTRTADELAAAIKGQSEAVLARRPDDKNWAAKEIVCHLRDAEEVFQLALRADPGHGHRPQAAGRRAPIAWPRSASTCATTRRRRSAPSGGAARRTLELRSRTLTPAQWDKGGVHPVRGRMTIDTFLTLMAWHDDNHLDQLGRALAGKA